MKILLSELRKIIRSIVAEQGWTPGRWNPESAEPFPQKDVELMGSAGMGGNELEEDELEEIDLSEGKKKKKCSGCSGKRPGLWCNICKKKAAGKSPAKPGEEGYPETLNINKKK